MDPFTPLFASVQALLLGLREEVIKPNKSNQKELMERHQILNDAFVGFDLAMHKLFAQFEAGNYDAAQADFEKFGSAIERDFRKIIYLVEDIRTKIEQLEIDELTGRLSTVAEKCSRVIGEWKQLQNAVARKDHDSVKRYCRRNHEVIKAYVEEIQSLLDYAEKTLERRQFKLKKPPQPALKNSHHRK